MWFTFSKIETDNNNDFACPLLPPSSKAMVIPTAAFINVLPDCRRRGGGLLACSRPPDSWGSENKCMRKKSGGLGRGEATKAPLFFRMQCIFFSRFPNYLGTWNRLRDCVINGVNTCSFKSILAQVAEVFCPGL